MNAPTPQHLSDLQRLYDAGQFVTAYRQAEAIAPLCQWRGTEARVLAARMARSVGARRSGDAYACRAFREAPRAARAFIHAAYSHLSRFGPLRTWEFLNTHEAQIDKYEPEDLRDRMLLRCQILAMMRDFVSAEQFLQDARRLDVKDSYWFVVAASMRIYQGEHDEAVQLGRQCLKEHPWYYPAVQLAAAELALQSRMPEAVELLEQAVNHIDTPLLWQQLAAYYMNANRLDDSLKAIDAMEACCPHSDREMINSLRFCRYDLLYRKNDRHAAAAELEQMQLGPAKSRTREQIERMLSRIRDDRSTSRRVQLEVPFIHQQYDTCAPTTLAMLCAYWGRPTDHRAIAAEVCYGGTPGFRQRQWAVENGWNAREFTLTENVAVQLVDRGVPFALTTSDPDSGHLMAVAGYDTCRETLIIRDPRQPLLADYPLADLLKRYADTGPLCLVIWPDHSNHLLQDLPLPDADILDKWHQVQVALDRHQREDAHRLVEEMAATHGDHRAVLYARLSISGYDLDAAAQIATVDKLLQAYPDSTLLALHKIHRLKDVARPAHRMELLEELARRPETHPGVWTQLATELLADARQHGRGRNLLRRALRCKIGRAHV